ncbi:hypothetical protein [Salinibaculum rarum]|uniref:hypothetical protein n=1 Tax=Salinibaculum rarum TaxID=3058903 RepID=UPI00265E6A2C|nr:hypothetical protein [Salinibaculum sp. KK48]
MSDDTDRPRPLADGSGQSGRPETRGTLSLSETDGYVGDMVTFSGRELPPNQTYDVRWHSSRGRWGVLEANEIVGPQYQHQTENILTVTTDESGQFDERWRVREDFGGDHAVELVDEDGSIVDRAEFAIRPWFELERTEAPLGEMFTITGYGIGPDVVRSNYQVTWDNGYVGFVTGVQNRGTARARIRAVGPPGEHVIQVWRNFRGIPYLQNDTQSPYGPVGQGRQYRWMVEVTEPEDPPATTHVDAQYDETPISAHYPDLDVDGPATLELTPRSGQAGTSVFVNGQQFPADAEVDLVWYRHEGHHMRGNITPEPDPDMLPSVTADSEGQFQAEIEIPAGQGGTRPIAAMVDGQPLALTGFMVQPDIERFEPTGGPAGTVMEIELSGLGWTAYENQPFFVYDNKPLGVVSSTTETNENGVVRVQIPAAGEPGWHFLEVYPTLSAVQRDEPDFEGLPHLSYLHNHPGRPLPAMHFAFEITS